MPLSTILITGGAGFIGGHLAEMLLAQGCRVRVLDDFSTGSRDNLPSHEALTIIEGDIRDDAAVGAALAGVDAVVHLAAMASVNLSFQRPGEAMDINVNGTTTVLDAARQAKVPKVVFASTAAVYDASRPEAKREDSPKLLGSPYAYSKWQGELLCEMYTALYDMDITVLRFFNVYGSRQRPDSQYSGVISAFMGAVLSGQPPTVYGDGLQTRDFVHVSNIARAITQAAQVTGQPGPFNIATGSNHALVEILDFLRSAHPVPFDVQHGEERRNDPRHSLADITAAREALGYHPVTDFETGLAEVYRWFTATSHTGAEGS